MKHKALSLAVLPLFASANAFTLPATQTDRVEPRAPGVVVVTQSTVLQSGETWTNTIWVQGGDILMEFGDSGGRTGSMVYLAASHELILNDDVERSYMRVDREFIDIFAANISGAMKQMEKAMAAMSEEQKKMMMEASGGRMPGMGDMSRRRGPEIRNTGETTQRNGYSTTRYDVVSGDLLTQQLWIADWSSVEHGAELRDALESLTALWASFEETMGDAPFGGASKQMVLTLQNGLPIITTQLDEEGTPIIETELQSVSEADVDRSAFGPKEGYREQRIEMQRMPGQ